MLQNNFPNKWLYLNQYYKNGIYYDYSVLSRLELN